MSLTKYSVKFMIFTRSVSPNRKNLFSFCLIVKNLEAVIQMFIEFARVSKAVVQKCSQNSQKTS